MGPNEMMQIAGLILEALEVDSDQAAESSIRGRVEALCRAHPFYPWLRSPRDRAGASPGVLR